MPAKSYALRNRFQPFCIKISLMSAPWSAPISKYSLPSDDIQFFACLAIAWYAANPLFCAYNAILGSCFAPASTRVSSFAIYGGLDTIISNKVSYLRGVEKLACFNFILSPSPNVRTLRRATRSARRDLSIPIPDAFGMFFTKEQIIHPVPVPKSNMRLSVLSAQSDIT